MITQKKNIAFLISGTGSLLDPFFQFIKKQKLYANIALIIASRKNLTAFSFANKRKIPYHLIEFKKFNSDIQAYSDNITQLLFQYNIHFVFMAGFLSPYYVHKSFVYKVINIHPSLIPSFCGKGYYGRFLYQEILNSGVKLTGISIHFVNNQYDSGPIIFQKSLAIKPNETLESLEKKIKNLEKKIYPLILKALLEKRIIIHKNYIKIIKSKN